MVPAAGAGLVRAIVGTVASVDYRRGGGVVVSNIFGADSSC